MREVTQCNRVIIPETDYERLVINQLGRFHNPPPPELEPSEPPSPSVMRVMHRCCFLLMLAILLIICFSV